MKTIEEAAKEYVKTNYSQSPISTIERTKARYSFRAGVEFAQRWIPFPSKEIPELNTDYLVKYSILGTEYIDIMTFRNTKEIGQVFTKIVSMGEKDGIMSYPVTHWRHIEVK